MTIRERLRGQEPTLSFELFPPRSPAAEEVLGRTMRAIVERRPDFISITYGASGSTQGASRSVVQTVAQQHNVPPLAHLTCVNQSRDDLRAVIEGYLEDGVKDFLALRGDPPQGQTGWRPHPDGLVYASDLVRYLRDIAAAHGIDDLCVGVAAFPSQHAIPRFRQTALDVLKAKQDAGADFAITQVFYDAAEYTGLVAEAAKQGIGIPIIPEVMPLVSAQRAVRAAHVTGVSTPQDLIASLESAGSDADAHARGVDYAARLSGQLLEEGAPGIHIITFNRHDAALDLVNRLGLRR
ncbi:methylenetetrahydrofolate reductase [Demequina sp. NBRC 110055]|uniref:methylenetetrahydrofolate reductase n=1 Tax=Demequina sp. NBRC 110055 TaxID=1570344 RepID=UPI000A0673BF|nr:methylenetetrahydrofolate reductase [Demequina sp. NBRC 110055]